MNQRRGREAGITGNPQAQAEVDAEVRYALRQHRLRFKRLMANDDFAVWFYSQITQRGNLMAAAPKDRGGEALARFEGRRDWAIEMYSEAVESSPNAWLKVLAAVEQETAKRKARMKQIEARAGVPEPEADPEEMDDA